MPHSFISLVMICIAISANPQIKVVLEEDVVFLNKRDMKSSVVGGDGR